MEGSVDDTVGLLTKCCCGCPLVDEGVERKREDEHRGKCPKSISRLPGVQVPSLMSGSGTLLYSVNDAAVAAGRQR